ncbi:MAG: RNA-binding domain-containing protein, partial [Fimbriimonadales bacterium]
MRYSADQIRKLLVRLDAQSASELETETLEFKEWSREWEHGESGRRKFYRMLAEYAVCFANHRGGALVLGVKERAKGRAQAITGCGAYNLHELRARVYDLTDPHILVEVEELLIDDLGARLLIVHIPQGVGVHTTTDGVAKMRVGTECKPMTGTLRQQRLVEAGLIDITDAHLPCTATEAFDALEIMRLKRFLEARTPHSPLLRLSDEQLLEHIGATQDGQPTVAGVLLIGKETTLQRYLPQHTVEYLRMRSETEYERREIYACGLLRALEEIERNIELYNRITIVKAGLFHYEIKDFPEESYREALLNAMQHRDYSSPAAVFVKHYHDRLEISNPGGFLAGISPENIFRQDSFPRNRRLTEMLRRVGLVERSGVGVKRMFCVQLSSGKPPPSYWSSGAMVRLTLHNGLLDEPFTRFVRQREREGKSLGLDELLVLFALRRQRELSLAEATHILQLPRTNTRAVLMRMVREGLLERSGTRRSQLFRLSGALYQTLGESIAYIREAGIDA